MKRAVTEVTEMIVLHHCFHHCFQRGIVHTIRTTDHLLDLFVTVGDELNTMETEWI